MSETMLAVRDETESAEHAEALDALSLLERSGAADEVSLALTDPDMPYDLWESMGRFLGSLERRSRWYIGDWLIFGEAVYGQAASQGVEATTKERYNEAERVTGLDHGTLLNIRSLCERVPRSRRRRELGFWMHEPVASLEPDEQVRWLQHAIDEGLNRDQLRKAIRDEKNPPAEPADDAGGDGQVLPAVSPSERIEEAARLVYRTAQSTSDGSYLVTAESMAQLRSALGEE